MPARAAMETLLSELKEQVGPQREPGVLDDAIAQAARAHRGQVDKSGRPYIEHVLRVAIAAAKSMNGDGRTAVVGLLHDVVEDTPATVDGLRRAYGDEIADDVAVLTRRDGEQYMRYIDRIAGEGSRHAVAVKLADLADHLQHRDAIPDSLARRYETAVRRLAAARGR